MSTMTIFLVVVKSKERDAVAKHGVFVEREGLTSL